MTPTDTYLTEDFSGGDYLLDLLATGLTQTEPVPQIAMEQAYSACLMSKVDAELAELIADSSRDATSLSGEGNGSIGEVGPEVTSELDIEGRDASRVVIQWIATVTALGVGAFRSWLSKHGRAMTPDVLPRTESPISTDQLHPAMHQLVVLR